MFMTLSTKTGVVMLMKADSFEADDLFDGD